MVYHPGLMFFLRKVSYPVSLAPELQEDEIGTLTGNVDIPLPGAKRIYPGHGTRIARGEGGTIIISIRLYLDS